MIFRKHISQALQPAEQRQDIAVGVPFLQDRVLQFIQGDFLRLVPTQRTEYQSREVLGQVLGGGILMAGEALERLTADIEHLVFAKQSVSVCVDDLLHRDQP